MHFLTEQRFSFISSALPADTFGVVRFTGIEAISFLYEFDIMLVTHDPALDLAALLQQPAIFSIHRPDGDQVDFNGILANCEQLHEYNGCVFYRALLRPRLWWLTLTRHNQVCLNMPVVPGASASAQVSLIGQCLNDGGLTSLDCEFRTQNGYAPVEYACQYSETHYNFIARWMEREGLYYFFEQTDHGEKLIITDTHISHVQLPQEGTLFYSPPSGLDTSHRDEVIQVLTCRQQQLPQRVLLKDHNYKRPGLDLNGQAEVDPRGRGEFYIYGDFFSTPEEGQRLAQLRAEELRCRQTEYFGESSVPFMMPGFTFSLDEHYRPDFNRRYLVTEVRHCGNQSGYLISGLQGGVPGNEKTVSYSNQFTAIAADVQFRPERKAQKPRISGTLHATIDAEGSGEYAELDEQGRYKVRLPFDINSQHGAGKASCFLRMAQPYAGPKRGMHFPLPKGTEVLLTFIDGDPDRPVIASAVPNPEAPSPSTAKNQTESVIQSGGNNKIRIEDKKGKERIIMESPTANSWVRIGAPNDPPDPFQVLSGGKISPYKDGNGSWNLQKIKSKGATAYEDATGTTTADTSRQDGDHLLYRLTPDLLDVYNDSGTATVQYNLEGVLVSNGTEKSEKIPATGIIVQEESFFEISHDWIFNESSPRYINLNDTNNVNFARAGTSITKSFPVHYNGNSVYAIDSSNNHLNISHALYRNGYVTIDSSSKLKNSHERWTAKSGETINKNNEKNIEFYLENDRDSTVSYTVKNCGFGNLVEKSNNCAISRTKIKILKDETFTFAGETWNNLQANDTIIDWSTNGTEYASIQFYREKEVVLNIKDMEEQTDHDKEGIRIYTLNDLWLEAHERFADYHVGLRADAPYQNDIVSHPPKIGNLLSYFGSTYKPSGIQPRHKTTADDLIPALAGLDTTPDSFDTALANAHVQVSSLDTFKTQEGNIYDFGGYWNYNMGNSYAECFIDQKPHLNADDLPHDLLDTGGPNFEKLNFPSLPSGATSTLGHAGDWDWSTSSPPPGIWVEKKIGNSYDYLNGDTVTVCMGSSLDIAHGGRHIEVQYRKDTNTADGTIASWSKKEGGITEEKKWTAEGTCILETTSNANDATSTETIRDRITGLPCSYTKKYNSGGLLGSFALSWVVTGSIEFSLAASSKIGIGAAFQFEMWWNPAGKVQLKNGKFQYHGIGSQLDKQEAVKAEIKDLYLANTLGWLTKKDFEAKSTELTAKVKKVGLDSGIYMMGF